MDKRCYKIIVSGSYLWSCLTAIYRIIYVKFNYWVPTTRGKYRYWREKRRVERVYYSASFEEITLLQKLADIYCLG